MAQAVNQSFPTDRRLNGRNPLGRSEQDQRSEYDVRREHGGYDDRSEQDLRREQDERNEQAQRRDHDGRRSMVGDSGGGRRERSTDRTRPATSTSSGDVFGPVLAVWGQAYASMFELAADMMRLQQRTFASMIAAADTSAERPVPAPGTDSIEARAYEIFVQRGREHGDPVGDWQRAEAELQQK